MKREPPEQMKLALDFNEWMSAKELAAVFGLNEESAYRWRREVIPLQHPKTKKPLIHFAGTRRILFHVDTIPFLKQKFSDAHGE